MKKSFIQKASIAAIMVFDNPKFGRIRLSLDENGEPLFCGKDVCEVLGYRNASDAVNQHVDIHDIAKRYVWVPCGMKADGSPALRKTLMLFVTESGFYALVMGSKLDGAQRFKLWVTSVVLPQIRKTGGYIPVNSGESDEETTRNAEVILRKTLKSKESFIEQQEKLIKEQTAHIVELNSLVDRLLPKALYVDNVLNSITCYTTTQIAKEMGLSAQELNRLLCALHVQYYQSGQYMLYVGFAHMGLAKSRTRSGKTLLEVGDDGFKAGHIYTHTYLVWTERGRKFIHQFVKKNLKLNTIQK